MSIPENEVSKTEQCPYLIYKLSKSCVNCTGYRCISAGREKKVDESQLEICRDINEYVNCVRYIDTLPVEPLETLELPSLDDVEETISYTGDIPYFELPDIPDITSTNEPEPEKVATPKGIGGVIRETTPDKTPPPPPPRKVSPCGCGHPDVRPSDCPYQGPAPEGVQSCLGIWCYAKNKNIRVDKTCVNWEICTRFLMSKYKGVPYYADQ